MITKRTLPIVIVIVVLAIVAVISSRFSPKRQERLDDALYNAVSEAVGRTHSVTAIEDALKNGANPNVVFNLGDNGTFHRTPLEIAAGNGNVKAVQLLLDHRADPNTVCTRGTALHAAVESGSEEIIDLLVQHGANVNTPGSHGESPLFTMVEMGKSRIVAHLLSLKADVNLKDYAGHSALSMAQKDKRTEIIEMLKKAGAR